MSLKDLYRRLSSLSPEQRALLDKLQQRGVPASTDASGSGAPGSTPPGGDAQPEAPDTVPTEVLPVTREHPERPVRLSPMQQRLWLLDQLSPANLSYSLPIIAFYLFGKLDVEALRDAFAGVVERHEVLRTVVRVVDQPEGEADPSQLADQAVQIVEPPPRRWPLPVVDLSRFGWEPGGDEINTLACREGRRPFDLENGPLTRTTLWRLAPESHLIQVMQHHIVSDGWSLGILYDELSLLYNTRQRTAPFDDPAGDPAEEAAERNAELPPLPFQYRDFSIWQRQWLASTATDDELAFWRRYLDGAPMVLDLPYDRPRPAVWSHHGRRRMGYLPPELEAPILALRRTESVTPYMLILAVLSLLLWRLTGQRDLLIGSPVAGRPTRGCERLAGFFVNTIVLRNRLTRGQSFSQLLHATREQVLEVFEHQQMPFDRLVKELQPQRDISYPPVYQVMFSLNNLPMDSLHMRGIKVADDFIQNGASQVDLILFCGRGRGNERFDNTQFEYNTDLFDDSTVARWLAQLQTLLWAVVRDPSRPLEALQVLPAAERHQLLCERHASVHYRAEAPEDRFLEQARRRPDAIAVSCGQNWLSYQGLARRADALAHRLRTLGAGPETLVAVSLERGPALIPALLGVLRSGAGYLPLDPSHPRQRRQFALADAGARVLVTSPELAAELEVPAGVTVVDPEAVFEQTGVSTPRGRPPTYQRATPSGLGTHPTQENVPHADPDSLGYVIYTSGSTGQPKGVSMPRRAIARLLRSTQGWYDFGPDDVMTLFHSFAFDVSVWEMWVALAHGGRLVIVPHSVARSPEALFRLLRRERVTLLDQTPSAFQPLIRAERHLGQPGQLALRAIIFAGEELDFASLRPWVERHGDAAPRLLNMYGITETTVHSSFRRVTASDVFAASAQRSSASLVGVPLLDQRLHLVDPDLRLVPVGVSGEICVSGEIQHGSRGERLLDAGLARGYLGRPALTASRFLPDPFLVATDQRNDRQERTGSRLYRSGDLARRLADGDLEYLGRLDFQVKIRGFRIELGEIEATLESHPAVREAAVLARAFGARGQAQDVRLVAYVVGREAPPETKGDQEFWVGAAPCGRPGRGAGGPDSQEPDAAAPQGLGPADLRQHLATHLPDYMIPGVFVPLDAMPLTDNGKLDRRALEALLREHPELQAAGGSGYVPPRDELEAKIAGLMADILGRPRVGAEDSFFDLGGHSLLATQLVYRLRREVGVELPLRALFEAPVVSALAVRVRQAENARERPPLTRRPRTPGQRYRAPLSFAQQRLWFLDRLTPDNAFYLVPAAWRLSGRLDAGALRRALEIILRRHDILRTSFESASQDDGAGGNEPQQVVEPRLPLPWAQLDLGGLPAHVAEREARRLAAVERTRPFDLEHAPLLRATLLSLSPRRGSLHQSTFQQAVLLLTQHHIVTDGWSQGVLLRELDALYRVADPARVLPALPVQYADYATWQRGWLAGEVLQRQLRWWRRELDAPPTLELPLDRPRPAMQTFRGGSLTLDLPASLGARLGRLAQEHSATLFMVLLAAFTALLQRFSGSGDLIIGSPIANRTQEELEGLLGFFVNTLALRCRPGRASSFHELIDQVRETALGAYAHQDVPFEKLVEELAPQRDLSRNPLFQVMFLLQNAARFEQGAHQRIGSLHLSPWQASLEDPSSGSRAASEAPSDGANSDATATRFDLEVHTWQVLAANGEPELGGALFYDRDLFDATTIRRLAQSFVRLLEHATSHPETPPTALRVLSQPQKHQLTHEWPHRPELPAPPALPRILERRTTTPDAIALQAGRAHVSYREMLGRTEQLASTLGGSLLRDTTLRDQTVGLLLDRSPLLFFGLLAAQRLGGAPLVLDPKLPAERLAYVLENSGLRLLLAHRDLLPSEVLAGLEERGVRVVWSEEIEGVRDSGGAALPSLDIHPEQLAFVVYTSGSTGVPKGVALPSRTLANLSAFHGQYTAAPGPVRTLSFAALSFDVVYQEAFPTWCAGGTLVLPTDEERQDPRALARCMARTAVERWHSPYVAFKQLAEVLGGMERSGDPSDVGATQCGRPAAKPHPDSPSPTQGGHTGPPLHQRSEHQRPADLLLPTRLKEIHVAGETLRITPPVVTMFRRLAAIGPGTVLWNNCGPTETHLNIAWPLRGDPATWPALPPIGRTITGGQLFVVDRRERLVPPGVFGEQYSAGVPVGRGYLNDPAKTAARFVPDAFSGVPGGRANRTGDLVRFRHDGVMEIVGRIDQQVKIRGFRVEPGDVEERLGHHPHVALAAVIVRQNARGENRLVAYVVLRESDTTAGPTTRDDLRAFLSRHLPDYMLPAAFVFLDDLPRTATGKLNRLALKALPEPEGDGEHAGRAPEGADEIAVAAAWTEVLESENPSLGAIGAEDDFFTLGGHSLLGPRVLARLRARTGVELPLRAIFEAPTVAAMARALAAARGEDVDDGTELVRIERDPETAYPLSFAQQRLWFLDQLTPHNPAYNLPAAWALDSPPDGSLDVGALQAALQTFLDRHEILRTRYPNDGTARQVVEPRVAVPFAVVDLQALTPADEQAETLRLTAAEAALPFDLTRAPVLRATLLRLTTRLDGGQRHGLLLNVHHIASDGWSFGVLLGEMATLYTHFGRYTHDGGRPHGAAPTQTEVPSDVGAAQCGRPGWGDPDPLPLPPLPIQYLDYAVWQRQRLAADSALLRQHLDWWRPQLDGVEPLALPTDRPRPALQRFRGGARSVPLPAATVRRLDQLGQRHGATRFMTLAAVFTTLLYRLGGQRDLVLGTPMAGRDLPELEPLIGCFINTLALRLRPAPTLHFDDLLRQVRDVTRGAFAHQQLPFETLVEELQPERDLSRNPLVQALFVLQNAGRTDLRLDGPRGTVTSGPLGLEAATARLDLEVHLWPTAGGQANDGEASNGEASDGETSDALTAVLFFDRDLFDATTIERLGRAFVRLAGYLGEASASPLAELPLLAAAERHQLCVEWAARSTARTTDDPGVIDAVRQQADQRPHAVAVCHGRWHTTYLTLQRRIDQRAADLLRTVDGIASGSTDVLVGLLFQRDAELPATLLAILAAGAAYLPLDPDLPDARLAFLLDDVRPTLLLLDPALSPRWNTIAELAAHRPAVLGLARVPLPCHSASPSLPATAPHGLAYVLHTSGSTGRPKGVAVARAALDHLLATMAADFRLGPTDVVPALATPAFDISLIELLLPLTVGGRVEVLDRETVQDGRRLQRRLDEIGATVVQATPSTWGALGPHAAKPHPSDPDPQTPTQGGHIGPPLHGDAESAVGVGPCTYPPAGRPAAKPHPDPIRLRLSTGEALPPTLAAQLAASSEAWNLYGPTETTVWAAATVLRPGDPVTLGRATAGSQLRVVDPRLRPLPIGCVGELLIAGRGLARGYFGHPARTAEAFIPDVFSPISLSDSSSPPLPPAGEEKDAQRPGVRGSEGPDAQRPGVRGSEGARAYRSGDLVRFLADGRLDYLGRRDHQVKLRGYRIELGEIEAALVRHPDVREAVVLAQTFTAGDVRLVAYVVGLETGPPLPSDSDPGLPLHQVLRQHLGTHLPDYMIPGVFVPLGTMPLTASGKVDHRALVAETLAARSRATGTAEQEGRQHIPPRPGLETTLAEIWQQVLGVERVGAQDHFFHLGGHSLLATRVLTRIQEALGVDLPLRALFEAPTLARLAERVADQLETAAAVTTSAPPLVPCADPRAPAPLSFAQERLWLLDRLTPGSNAYNLPVAWYLDASSSKTGARQARATVAQLARRHAILRTRFGENERGPWQQVLDALPPIVSVDLRCLGGNAAAERRRLLARNAARPFDLETEAPLRALVLEEPSGGCVVGLTFHHLVADGWSFGIVERAFHRPTRGTARGTAQHPARSTAPELQYLDYATWQRAWLTDDVILGHIEWWRRRLDTTPDGTAPLELPTDHPRPTVQRFRGGLVTRPVAPELRQRLDTTATQLQASRFQLALATFAVLLQRHASSTPPVSGPDVVIGVPMADRPAGTEDLIGFFVNTLPVRLSGSPTAPFAELVRHSRDSFLDAREHRHVPFERVLQALDLERDLSRNPVFQVTFSMQDFEPRGETETAPRRLPVDTATTRFDLEVHWLTGAGAQAPDGLAVYYDRDLFDTTTVERWFDAYVRLLTEAVEDPAQPVDTLPILSPAQRQQLLHEWADGLGETRAPSLSELLTRHATWQPDAIAVSDGRRRLSYAALVRDALRLATALRARGAGADVLIALEMTRCPELLVALLGVILSGAGYLPLDPRLPAARRQLLLDDAGARLHLRRADVPQILAQAPPIQLTARLSAARQATPEHPDQLAYLLYTSGSTGTPKGVAVRRGSVARLLTGMADWLRLQPGDAVPALTTISFDIAVAELLLPLAAGARVELIGRTEAMEGARLGQRLQRDAATLLQATPATWTLLLDAGWDRRRQPLPQLLSTGEALPAALANRLRPHGARLWNLYGPTETTVWASAGPVRSAAVEVSPIDIGRPIPGTHVHILDRDGRPVPIGVTGELLVTGDGLARGYHRRPALTAEVFVPNPLFPLLPLLSPLPPAGEGGRRPGTDAQRPGVRGYEDVQRPGVRGYEDVQRPGVRGSEDSRAYRTGDLARFLADGTLEHLGRRDHQLKLRGFRIEPGEIEAALAALPTVRAAAVQIEGEALDARLAAWVVPATDTAPSTPELRVALAETLPDYMLPSVVYPLDALPLTPSGKVDRKALSRSRAGASPTEPAAQHSSSAPPRTPTEARLAVLYVDLLPSLHSATPGSIPRDTHFFRGGGHSLLATRLVARLRAELGVELPLRSVFEAPTLAELAARVDLLLEPSTPKDTGHIPTIPRDAPIQASFAQQRLWFLDRLTPGGSGYNLPQASRLHGHLDVHRLAAAVHQLQARHEVLRAHFEEHRGLPYLAFTATLAASIPLVDLQRLDASDAEAQLQALVDAETARPFDLATGPLLRTCLIRLADDDHGWLLTLHHTVADGWSMGILGQELARAYTEPDANATTHPGRPHGAAPTQNRPEVPPSLPPLPIQYADYAAWQRQRLQGDFLDAQLAVWRRRLATPSKRPLRLALPTDRPRPPVQRFRGGEVDIQLGADLRRSVETLAQRFEATPFMVLLTAYFAFLHRQTRGSLAQPGVAQPGAAQPGVARPDSPGGQRDLVVGTPVAGRTHTEVEGLIGLFVNTLALRVRWRAEQTFEGLLRQVREVALEAYGHQEVPFEKLVEELQPHRDLARNPIFQTMFALQDLGLDTVPPLAGSPHASSQHDGNLRVEPLRPGQVSTHVDLELHLAPVASGGYQGSALFDADLFDATTVQRWLGHYQRLLASASAEPRQLLGDLPLLSAAEAHQLERESDGKLPAWLGTGLAAGLAHEADVSEQDLDLDADLDLGTTTAGGAPRGDTERRLAAIFSHLLQVDEIGRDSQFFHLGGHSLLATRALARLREAFGVEVSVREFFEHPTVQRLAIRVEMHRSRERDTVSAAPQVPGPLLEATLLGPTQEATLQGARRAIVPIQRGPESLPPASFAQQRFWMLDRLSPGSPAYNLLAAWRLRSSATDPFLQDGAFQDGACLPNIARLEAALGALVERHEALRTVLVAPASSRAAAPNNEPRQRILPAQPTPLPVVDLGRLDAPEAELRRLAATQAHQSFRLDADLPWRAALVRLAPTDATLLFTIHHAAADGWSLEILQRELGLLYRTSSPNHPGHPHWGAPTADQNPALPPLPVQYADFAVWQRRHLHGSKLAAEIDHWRQRLLDPPVLNLPSDRRRPARQGFQGSRRGFWLDANLGAAVEQQAQAMESTPFMVLMSAFLVLLARLADSSQAEADLIVGTPVAGRLRPELEGLIGCFVNTLALRARVRGHEHAFVDLLADVRETALDAFAHQEVPFEKLVEELQPRRDLARNPFFDVLFALQNTPGSGAAAPEFDGLRAEPLQFDVRTARFDLELHLWPSSTASSIGGGTAAGLTGVLFYDRDLFDAVTVQRFGRSFATLLRAALREPEVPLGRLSLLSAAERQQLQVEWAEPPMKPNFTEENSIKSKPAEYSTTQAGPSDDLVTRIQHHARRRPDAIALSYQLGARTTGSLSYRELLRRAGHVAYLLHQVLATAHERDREDVIALAIPSGPWRLPALLGVLLHGATVLPLDEDAPPRRAADWLRETSVRLLLRDGSLPPRLAEAVAFLGADAPPSFDLQTLGPHTLGPQTLDLDLSTTSSRTTAGTSATPRDPRSLGCLLPAPAPAGTRIAAVTRGALSRTLASTAALCGLDAPGVSERTAVPNLSPVDTAHGLVELLLPLTIGGRVQLLRRTTVQHPRALAWQLRAGGATFVQATPTVWQSVIDAGWYTPSLSRQKALQLAVIGGDLPRDLAAFLRPQGRRLWNVHGMPEAAAWATATAVEDTRRSPGAPTVLDFGRPLPGVQAMVHDGDLQPVPQGVIGELCFASTTNTLARGYHNRPALTADRFRPDPTAGYRRGSRLFRTGDLARTLQDGRLQLLGRIDRRLDLRGVRIEPAEVEALLCRHPTINAAAVVARQLDGVSPSASPSSAPSALQPPQLVAYLVAAPGCEVPSLDELRRYLQPWLPDAAIPTQLVPLDALPKSNHRVDLQALPSPQASRPQLAEAPAAPRSELEEKLASIWRDLLAIDDVGIHDDFFALGGHSLLAIRLQQRLHEDLGYGVALVKIFENPTVARLASALGA